MVILFGIDYVHGLQRFYFVVSGQASYCVSEEGQVSPARGGSHDPTSSVQCMAE